MNMDASQATTVDDRLQTARGRESTMKAIVQDAYGPAEVLELREIDRPVPKDDEVLVRVHAAGLDRGVWHVMTGLPYLIRFVVPTLGVRRPKVPVRGMDLAGRVEAIGDKVTRFRPGDAVFGWTDSGSYAEYSSAPEDHLARKPATLTFEQAAAVPISAFAALQGLRDEGQVQPGQRVLVIGAAGGSDRSRCSWPRRSARKSPGCAARPRSSWSARSVPTRSSTTPGTTPPMGRATGP
jgi:D-arabinose 1-dehydrogenase-like Zn-dependent alcohol dehydrogenase